MTKQAPTPWTLTENSWQYTTIYDAEGTPICRLDLEDWNVTEDNQDELERVQTQIARRIIDAINLPATTVIQNIEAEARRYAEMYPQSSDGRNTFVIFADWVASQLSSKEL